MIYRACCCSLRVLPILHPFTSITHSRLLVLQICDYEVFATNIPYSTWSLFQPIHNKKNPRSPQLSFLCQTRMMRYLQRAGHAFSRCFFVFSLIFHCVFDFTSGKLGGGGKVHKGGNSVFAIILTFSFDKSIDS